MQNEIVHIPYEITVIQAGPPGKLTKTIRKGDVFTCPECGSDVPIILIEGFKHKVHPTYPLPCPVCNKNYGIVE